LKSALPPTLHIPQTIFPKIFFPHHQWKDMIDHPPLVSIDIAHNTTFDRISQCDPE
jgi:hypothetical protein